MIENRFVNGEFVETIRIQQEPDAAILALHPGYIHLESYTVLYKPPEAEALKDKLTEIADALPDEMALEHVDIYPAYAIGTAYQTGQRIRQDGVLYRIVQDHTAQEDWPPDTTASLYTRVNQPGAAPEPWVQGSYALGTKVTHKDKTWESQVDNNVWEPGAEGVHDTIWKEVTA